MAQLDEFNVIQFEKRLTALKDSQDNINACCKWCLENRQHHKKIVNSWLNVLKRVKVEQRLNLFYLANDVIQYSKRKQYEFVESWGTALQKATTLVRDEKVKHKIVRIFNIWQQRGVYNEEFISDLCGLISVVPTASKNDEPHEFQANYVINKIKQCTKLENETDTKLKILKEHNPKIPIETESLCVSLKDRAHVDDVEKELETYVKHLEGYINALKAEIKCRISNISVLKQANNHLDKDKKDVKVVANAYKLFGNKVKTFQKKLEEHKATLASPIPSPDINAPSPSPDCDIELPDDEPKTNEDFNTSNTSFSVGYYNPVPPPSTEATNFVTNGYTSFIGSNFGVEGIFTTTQTTSVTSNLTEVTNSNFNLDLRTVLQSVNPPPPPSAADTISESSGFPYQEEAHLPLLPPPMPPFSTKSDYENPYDGYSNSVSSHSTTTMAPSMNYGDTSLVAPSAAAYDNSTNYNAPSGFESVPSTPTANQMQYPPLTGGATGDDAEYNPEQETEWDAEAGGGWPPPLSHPDGAGGGGPIDTPESPPMFEKEGYIEGVEYHDGVNPGRGAVDVDHRLLHPMMDGIRGRGKDVDHRNLISLTGSPADTNSDLSWGAHMADKDKQNESLSATDQDYRLPPFNFEHLKLPPPPPPPKPQLSFPKNKSPPKKMADNTESIDMELSEDDDFDVDSSVNNSTNHKNNLKVLVDENDVTHTLKPPPPFPDLPDDVDANSFLDDLDNELNSNEFTANLQDPDCGVPPPPLHMTNVPPPNFMPNHWQSGPPPPPLPPMNMNNHPPPHHQQMKGPPPPFMNNFEYNRRGGNRGGRPPMHRGRGRGQFGFRGANNFRGRGFSRGGPMKNRGRGGMRGAFQGGY